MEGAGIIARRDITNYSQFQIKRLIYEVLIL